MAGPFKTSLTVEALQADELYGILLQADGEAKPLSTTTIAAKLRAAEDFYERDLQVFFGVKRVKSDPIERGIPVDDYDVDDPAYNFETDLWDGERWGWMQLRRRPIVGLIEQCFISYPGTGFSHSYTVPQAWLRLDRRRGTMQIVPTGGAAIIAQFNGFILSLIAGGRGLPRSIFVDYRAGLSCEEIEANHSDLLDGIKARTIMSMAGTLALIRSGGLGSHSISQDGQSQTESFGGGDYGPYTPLVKAAQDRDKEARAAWRQQTRGVTFTVV